MQTNTTNGRLRQAQTKRHHATPFSRALRWYLDRDRSLVPDTTSGSDWDLDNLTADPRQAFRDAGLQEEAWPDDQHTFGIQLGKDSVRFYTAAALMSNSPKICRWRCAVLVPEAMGPEMDFTQTRIEEIG